MANDFQNDSSFSSVHERLRATLARNVMLARRAKFLNQGELAERANHSRQALAEIETGVADPTLSTICDFANALNINPFMLLLGDGDFNLLVEMSEELRVK